MYAQDELKKILDIGSEQLTPAERIALINDLDASMRMGKLPAAEGVRAIQLVLKDKEHHVVQISTDVLSKLDLQLLTPELREEYAAFVRNLFGESAHELGWNPKQNEDDATKQLRVNLMLFEVQKGQDTQLETQANDLARGWFNDHKAVQPDLVPAVLCAAAIRGDEALWDLYHDQAKQSQVPEERTQILDAMGCFEDLNLASKALNVIMSNDFDIRESLSIGWKMMDHFPTRKLVYDFVTQNFDELKKRLPRDYEAELARVGTVFCNDQNEKGVESFFRPRISKVPGGPRILDQTLEEIRLCSAFRNAQQASFKDFLQSYQHH
jgi:alanyl aminopeptidase